MAKLTQKSTTFVVFYFFSLLLLLYFRFYFLKRFKPTKADLKVYEVFFWVNKRSVYVVIDPFGLDLGLKEHSGV